MLRTHVGSSNDLASLLYCRSSAEIITSRTPSAEIITLSAAHQLVRCHDNEVDTLALSMQQDNVIIYGRLKKKLHIQYESVFIKSIIGVLVKYSRSIQGVLGSNFH
jgi:hypothetical protein